MTKEEFYIDKIEGLKLHVDCINYAEYNEIEAVVKQAILLINSYYESDTQYVKDLSKIVFTSPVSFGDGYAWKIGQKKIKNILNTVKFDIEIHKGRKEISLRHFWEIIHPEVRKTSEEKFNKEEYKDAVFASSVQLSAYIKNKVGSKAPAHLDNTELMEMVFGKPVLSLDDSSLSGKNIHSGYQKIFSGYTLAIRNPKAHGHFEITKENALHLIYLSSLLFYKVDEAKIM